MASKIFSCKILQHKVQQKNVFFPHGERRVHAKRKNKRVHMFQTNKNLT